MRRGMDRAGWLFKSKPNITLCWPDLPCCLRAKHAMDDQGQEANQITAIMEAVKISLQRVWAAVWGVAKAEPTTHSVSARDMRRRLIFYSSHDGWQDHGPFVLDLH